MIKIKKYNDKYRKEVNNLLYKILIEEYGFNEFKNGLLEKDYKIFKKMKNRLWIAIDTETNRLIGTTGFVCLNKKEALLKLVYVDKESRGTGMRPPTCPQWPPHGARPPAGGRRPFR